MSIVSDAATARGVWPRFLAGFVKEKKIMSLEEGIKRCTSVPARRVCKDRGVLKPGFWADIVVMDYDKIDTEARLKYELWDGPGPFPKGYQSGRKPETTGWASHLWPGLRDSLDRAEALTLKKTTSLLQGGAGGS
mgnify:CR=1 FL=1